MAIYEYYCPTCRTRFQERRPMAQAAVMATCAGGHRAERMVSTFAAPRAAGGVTEIPGAGGCCGGGGGCACAN
ncbi:MAG: FmdB family zinc ribbon protein [Tepidiformaceae bacterium]